MSEFTDWAPIVLPAASALAAFASAAAGWTSASAARASKRAAQGNVVARLMADYASREIAEAISTIRDQEENIEMYRHVGVPLAHLVGPDAAANQERTMESGRRIHFFVWQAKILLDEKIITKNLFRAVVASTPGYALWASIWLPFLRSSQYPAAADVDAKWGAALVAKFPPSYSVTR